MKHLPAWIGWPGTGPVPGHDWLPGPRLRLVILTLTYAFLALALTVDYAYSTAFFLLAIIGLYVGLRRGFGNGLARAERLVILTFVAYVAVAIASFLLGEQTRVGFRFMGRDLRFLLFIPVFVAIRWARPKARHLGLALAGAAVGAFITALLLHRPWPAPIPHGVTGTHITFGDLAIISGFLAAALLWQREANEDVSCRTRRLYGTIGGVAIFAGAGAGVVASARGGWVAIPILLLLFLWSPPVGTRFTRSQRLAFSFGGIVMLAATAWAIPGIHERIDQARRNLATYITVAKPSAIDAPCVDRKTFLQALVRHSRLRGPGEVRVAKLPQPDRRQVTAHGCGGGYALSVVHVGGAKQRLEFNLFRGNNPLAPPHPQAATLLVKSRGTAVMNIGWKQPWIRIGGDHDWKIYRMAHTEKGTQWINLFITRGSLWLIPIQMPRGFFAYELAKTSIGHRLEMWRAAWALFLRHPVLGAGTGAFYPFGEEALGASAMKPIVGDFQHAHSDYLTSLSTRGIVGFLSLILVLACPWLALRSGHGRLGQAAAPLAGAVLTGGMAVFALTETMFVHSFVLSWFAVVTAALLAAATGEQCRHG